MMEILRRGPLTPSIPTFPNTNLRKTVGNLLVVLKIKKMSAIISVSALILLMGHRNQR